MSILLFLPEVRVFRFHVDFGINHFLESPLTEGSSDGHPGR